MFSYISGKLVYKEPSFAVIETGGIGYEMRISLNTYSHIVPSEACKLFTYLHIKEDAHTLYGFTNPQEKSLFLKLIGVSGIGPSTGLMLLSSLSAEEINHAILAEDVSLFQSVKGIGAKTAKRLVLELKDKVGKDATIPTTSEGITINATDTVSLRESALEALLALGFQRSTAEKNLSTVIKRHGNQLSVEELIKLALKSN